MRHLLISREYPPAPAGGIGTYAAHMARALAAAGEVVHVIGQAWAGAASGPDAEFGDRLIVHRVPMEDPGALIGSRPHPQLSARARDLFRSDLPAQAFAWEAALLAERLVREEGIDIIEAQEYEAPLCILQMRRQLGLGPDREPPCIVHLHSPTDFIARHNDWSPALPLAVAAGRLERFSIRHADALLCPSRFLARQAAVHFDLAPDTIEVIPLPLRRTDAITRAPVVWRAGDILYAGRLERRKGVLEWIEAAVDVARERTDARFVFMGANVLGTARTSGPEEVRRRIPRELADRFIFHPHGGPAALRERLANARLAAVPSRWENFPYVCVEAMASGLPVLATPNGGMAEMIEPGSTGWIAASAAPVDLAAALRTALDTPADRLSAMGAAAATAIAGLCDADRIVERHLQWRARLVARTGPPRIRQGAKHASAVPGIACVVIEAGDAERVATTMRSLETQTQAPAAVCTVRAGVSTVEARNHGLAKVLAAADLRPEGIAFIDAGTTLAPGFIAACSGALAADARVAIVTGWSRRADGTLIAPPPPAFPWQWQRNDVAPWAAFRTDAIVQAGGFRAGLAHGFEHWDMANAVLAAEWTVTAWPDELARLAEPKAVRPEAPYPVEGMRRALLERFPDLAARDAIALRLLAEWGETAANDAAARPKHDGAGASLRTAIAGGLRHPLATARTLLTRLRHRARTAVRRGSGSGSS